MLLIKTDGTRQELPYTGNLNDWYKIIGCTTVECVSLLPGVDMWIDEDGRIKDHEINATASKLYRFADGRRSGYIAGNVLICGFDETTGDSRELTDDERNSLASLETEAVMDYASGDLGAPFDNEPPTPPPARFYACDGLKIDEILKELFQ